jgi:peptidoglycan/xylan/chitin deacetylase (PgdA/CDA1 family)
MHPVIKRRLEAALASRFVSSVSRKRTKGRRLILAYHGVMPDGATPVGEQSLFVAQRTFAAQLDILREIADVAPLDRIDEEGDGRPRVAITLDDAYKGAVYEGVTELVKRHLPATIFVAPGLLGGRVFWWDALSSPNGVLDDSVRDHALNALAGSDIRIRQWASITGLATTANLPDYARSATVEELHAAVKHAEITLGSHTWSHPNLARLDIAEIIDEMTQSRAALKAQFGSRVIDWLAYPYGFDSVAARQAAAASGYVGAVRVEGGWHSSARAASYARPRLNVPSDYSVARLKAHVVGALLS